MAFQGNGASSQEAILEENRQWQTTAFPSYLQSAKDDFCQNWDEAVQVYLLATNHLGSRVSGVLRDYKNFEEVLRQLTSNNQGTARAIASMTVLSQDVERKQSLQRGRERPNAVTSSNPVWQAMR